MANDWIDRKAQEPPRDGEWFIGDLGPGLYRWSRSFLDFQPRGDFKFWMPLPAPPERKVTIEISEALARYYIDLAAPGSPAADIARACAAALKREGEG